MTAPTLQERLREEARLIQYGERACVPGLLHEAADALDRLEKLDREAAECVETVICMRTHFTGEPPYVGWKGIGLALTEALDRLEADAARYRWLRDQYRLMSPHMDGQHHWAPKMAAILRGPSVDAAIDAAMKQEGGK